MSFNGVFDIPALVMILILMSTYALRKSYARSYGMYVLFVVFYIHFASFINLIFIILTNISFVETYMINHKSYPIVQASKILFGREFSKYETTSRD